MDREKHTQIMFEGFRLPAMFLSPAAALSLYASGRDTGLVVDSGADCTWITPVFEGYALPLGSYQLNVAGSAITEHLRRLSVQIDSSKRIVRTHSADLLMLLPVCLCVCCACSLQPAREGSFVHHELRA